MNLDELEAKLIRLMSYPLKSQIKIDFDQSKRIFRLSSVIYRSGKKEVPRILQNYVTARQGMTFQPHSTSYHHVENEIQVIQEIPFQWGFQATLRTQIHEFWNLAKHCHQMLMEMAAEERLAELLKDKS